MGCVSRSSCWDYYYFSDYHNFPLFVPEIPIGVPGLSSLTLANDISLIKVLLDLNFDLSLNFETDLSIASWLQYMFHTAVEDPVHGEHVPVDGAAGVPAQGAAAALGVRQAHRHRVGEGRRRRGITHRQSQMGE